jgi:5-deoxy-D-glucuronate isomerase
MKYQKWLFACLAVVAAGLIAGCGGGDDTTSAPTATAAGETASGDATPDDVYQACVDGLQRVASESTVQTACGQVRDAFEQCATQASNAPEGSAREAALNACQDAANKATDALNASP